MVDVIDFNKAKCIVELGPGTGVFTKEIMKRKKQDTIFLLIEINEVFCKELKRKFKDEQNVIVVHGSAENIKKYMEEFHIECVDYVLSGLPFTSLPEEVSKRILNNVMEAIHENGEFITFQYSLVKKGFIQHFFPKITLEKVWLNFPPAYIFSCKKRAKESICIMELHELLSYIEQYGYWALFFLFMVRYYRYANSR